MPTLADAQQTINASPSIACTVGGRQVGQFVGRYRWYVKADAFGRMALWLDNSGGRFNDRATDWPQIKRGKEVVLTRGLAGIGSAAIPTFWVETIMYSYFQDVPYLLLDCIDWVGRLRYYRYATTQTWTATEIQTIVSSILGEVGLTLAGGSFTSLTIDYEITPQRSAWSAIRDLMSRIPEVLYSSQGTTVAWKVLDSTEAASYDFAYSASDGHPVLDDSDVAESTPVFNSFSVQGGPNEEYLGQAENAAEIGLLGYRRRRTIVDRRLLSDAACEQRAESELEYWNARGTAGVIVARPHFTAKLFDVVSAPAPVWGGPAIGAGFITKITEWYNYGTKKFDQALVIGEVPPAAAAHVLGPDNEEVLPLPTDNDPGDAGGGTETGDTSSPPEVEIIETGGVAEVIIPGDLALGSVSPDDTQGLIHGYNQHSGFLHWEYPNVGGTAVEIIPNGNGDVTAIATIMYTLQSSGGTPPDDVQGGLTTLDISGVTSSNLYNEADGTCVLRLNADGSLDVRRTAGTSTFKVAFWVLWI